MGDSSPQTREHVNTHAPDGEGFKHHITTQVTLLLSQEWPRNTLLNLYLFGSRLYGCHKPDSDYDFMGICDGDYFYAFRLLEAIIPAESSPTKEELSLSVNMMHVTYFRETLKDAFINSVMLCFMPHEFAFLETVATHTEFILHLPNIRQSVQMDSTHNFAKAKRLWRLGNYYTAKKNLVHGLRYLNYSLQLLGPRREIYDFSAGNEYFAPVMALEEPKEESDEERVRLWRSIDKQYAPIYKTLTDEMKRFCDVEVEAAQAWEWAWLAKHFGVTLKAAQTIHRHRMIPPSILVDYIKEYGLEAVSRRFGVTCSRHTRHRNLVSLSRTQMACLELSLVRWCSGIILDEADDMRIVALPFPKIFSTTSNTDLLPVVDWTNISIEQQLDGRLALLYYYGNEWNVASSESADGSELIGWTSPIRLPNWRDYVLEGFNFNPVHEANMLIPLLPNARNPTFSEHFWDVFHASGLSTDDFDPSRCYMFELQSPWLIHLVEHKERSVVLIGARNMATGEEEDVLKIASRIAGARTTLRFHMSEGTLVRNESDGYTKAENNGQPLETIQGALRFCDPTVTPGYLVRMSDGRRLSFRSPQFLSLDRLHPLSDQGQLSKLLLELARCLCARTWLTLPKFSYWASQFAPVDLMYQRICAHLQELWEEVRKVAKTEGRGAAAELLSRHPSISSEPFLLIKLNLLDTTMAEHLSMIPLKRLQTLVKRVQELMPS